MERQATIEDLKDNYHRIYYKAGDGSLNKLADYFPLKIGVANQPNWIYLDTGGEMEGCDFGIFTIDEGKLFR